MQETIKASIRRYIKVFRDAAANNLNEAVKGLIKAGASVEKLTMRRKPKPEMRKTVEKDQQPI